MNSFIVSNKMFSNLQLSKELIHCFKQHIFEFAIKSCIIRKTKNMSTAFVSQLSNYFSYTNRDSTLFVNSQLIILLFTKSFQPHVHRICKKTRIHRFHFLTISTIICVNNTISDFRSPNYLQQLSTLVGFYEIWWAEVVKS